MDFPIYNSKELADGNTFDLSDPVDRKKYFEAKLGSKIADVKNFLDSNTFVGFLISKKMGGKSTYSKIFEEIVGAERFQHISVGDIVRDMHKAIENDEEKNKLMEYMKVHYRGLVTLDDALDAFINRTQDKLIPTEFILTLIKREIEKIGRKAIFIDGMPRSLDQISYSLFFRDLINFRDDPDFFVLLDVPESVIDARIKTRRVCPICHTSKNLSLNPSKFVEYNEEHGFYLLCDNATCSGYQTQALVAKEGDAQGVELIRERLENDGSLLEKIDTLDGVALVRVRTTIPKSIAAEYIEDYELNPEFVFTLDEQNNVKMSTKLWVVKDDTGEESNVIIAATIFLSMFDKIHKILCA